MRWFKHQTGAHSDVRLKKLIMRQGMAAYGLYWYCLELIGKDVSESKLTFEIEEDSELLAHATGMTREQVEAAMKAMVDLGLFHNAEGRVFCLKMLDYIDASMFKAGQIRESFKAQKEKIGQSTRAVQVPSTHGPGTVRAKQDRTGQDITEHKPLGHDLAVNDRASEPAIDPFDVFWEAYPKKVGKVAARKSFTRLSPDPAILIADINNRLRTNHWSLKHRQYIPGPAVYLNNRGWEDEIVPRAGADFSAGAVAHRTQEILDRGELDGGLGL